MELDIIIPVYNEQENIISVLRKIEEIDLSKYITKKMVVIVDDCSQDNSCALIEEYIHGKQNFILLKHEINKGKGAAVRYGIEKSTGDLIFIQDADLELCPDDLIPMLEAMFKLKVQFVNGSRYLPGIVRPLASYKRYLANRFFTFLTSLLLNVKLTDMACGYKLFHRQLYNKISLRENRFGFEAELIIKALKIKKNNITEVPVQYFPRNAGEGKKLKTTDGFKILWSIFKYGVFKAN